MHEPLPRRTAAPIGITAVRVLHRDLETRGTINLQKVGAAKYAANASTEVICVAFAADADPVRLWLPGDPVPPEFIEAAADPSWIVCAHNDAFESAIEQHVLAPHCGWPIIPIERHRCTMAMCLALGLPARLGVVADALELEHRKDAAGERLMHAMSKPRKPRKDEDPAGSYWFDDPDRLQRLYSYCKQDVEVERELHDRLLPLSAAEQALWALSSKINARGFYVDRQFAEAARAITQAAAPEIDAELAELTGGAVTGINQVARLLQWLQQQGCTAQKLDHKTIEKLLNTEDLPPPVRRVLELRLGGAQAAVKKIDALLARAGDDGRVRGAFKYHGATTGRWAGEGFQPPAPERHASTKDPGTWCDYNTALAAVQAGKADGISYVLTEADPFAAIDLDHSRHAGTHSIDVWGQNYLDVARHTYAEVTPSGEGFRIWGLTGEGSDPVNRKFSLEIDGKQIAAELFRRTPKALTITGYRLDTIRELGSLDKAFGWAIVWGERRKAAAAEAAAAAAAATQVNGHSFNGGGPGHDIDRIEQIVREGPLGGNRSDTFHIVVGHYLGCGWSVDRIHEHLRARSHPAAGLRRYTCGRCRSGIVARKYTERALPVCGGWTAPGKRQEPPPPETGPPEPQSPDPELKDDDDPELDEPEPAPQSPDPELDDPEAEPSDPELEDDEFKDEPPPPDPDLPRMYSHGDPDPRPLKVWLIKRLMPAVGHGLLSGQWGTGKTFIAFDLAAALGTGQPFLGHAVKRQCGTLLIAGEGANEVRLRLDAVVRAKCGGAERIPFRWYETAPLLLQKDAAKTLIEMARQADKSLRAEFGLPLGLIVVDTYTACAGYTQTGAESDSATGQAVMNVLKAIAQALNCALLDVLAHGQRLIDQSVHARDKGLTTDDAPFIFYRNRARLMDFSMSVHPGTTRPQKLIKNDGSISTEIVRSVRVAITNSAKLDKTLSNGTSS